MTDTASQIVRHLTQLQTYRELADKTGHINLIRKVQEWQCERLLATHNDLWKHPRFQPAMQFFIDELYGPKDFSQRDQDIARVVPKLAKVLPDKAMVSLEVALKLNTLSFQLDYALAQALDGQAVNRDSYAKAYQRCDNQAERSAQIDAIETLGHDLADVVGIRGISMLLKLARKPAKLAGLLTLHEFLEDGYRAFKHMGQVEDFIVPIVSREREIMQQLFAAGDNPLPEGL